MVWRIRLRDRLFESYPRRGNTSILQATTFFSFHNSRVLGTSTVRDFLFYCNPAFLSRWLSSVRVPWPGEGLEDAWLQRSLLLPSWAEERWSGSCCTPCSDSRARRWLRSVGPCPFAAWEGGPGLNLKGGQPGRPLMENVIGQWPVPTAVKSQLLEAVGALPLCVLGRSYDFGWCQSVHAKLPQSGVFLCRHWLLCVVK